MVYRVLVSFFGSAGLCVVPRSALRISSSDTPSLLFSLSVCIFSTSNSVWDAPSSTIVFSRIMISTPFPDMILIFSLQSIPSCSGIVNKSRPLLQILNQPGISEGWVREKLNTIPQNTCGIMRDGTQRDSFLRFIFPKTGLPRLLWFAGLNSRGNP